jgi:hypothetical protein
MKPAIFSALVWAASSALIGPRSAVLSGSEQMLRTLRGWGVAALMMTVAMRLLWRETKAREESLARQACSALSAFVVFSALVLLLIAAPGASSVAFLRGVLAATMAAVAVVALGFPVPRPRAVTAAALMYRPCIIRTNHPRTNQAGPAGEKLPKNTAPERT